MRNRSFIFLASLTLGCLPNGAMPTPNTAPLTAIKTIPVGQSPHGMAAAGGFVYNSNSGSGTVSVIDTATDQVVKEITPPHGHPGYAKAFHDGRHVLILDESRLLVIDPNKNHQIVQTVQLGEHPDRVAISDDDQRVLVSQVDSQVLVLTFSSDRSLPPTRQEFAVGSLAGDGHAHRAAWLAGDWAIVPNSADQTASLINLTAGTVRHEAVGNDPGPVGLGLFNGRATVGIVGNKASHTFTFLDLAGGASTTISAGGQTPTDMAMDVDHGRAFVTLAGTNEVAVLDYATKSLLNRIPVGKRPVHIFRAPALGDAHGHSHELWVGNDDGASVSVIDTDSLAVKATLATGNGHHKMAFANDKVYVSNLTDGTVSVIDRKHMP